jgi:hypothetical protein
MIGPRLRAAAVLLVVFAVGSFAGTAFERHHIVRVAESVSLLGENEVAMTELSEFLDLDDEQVAQVHAVLAENQHVVQLMWEEFRPEVQAAMREVHMDIAAVLRPDQAERFHAWILRHGSGPDSLGLHDR